ncbi:PqqD family protein [Pedobacter sp. MC2016-14]|uniref:PqqD family protein n=1 Tax=Pedobacter sp. MC2016-14 TaxID=2897327 RepID=UPI001E2F137C|nr:PqqD family protein [Pedobacter sp. MC2016-14]MCD0486930.1 PqqD family protein [Pedobacter sp. MC2016-14]
MYYINKEKVLLSQIADEGVLFDLEKNEYKHLNETLFKILEGIQLGQDASAICDGLVEQYAIAKEECLKKVEQAIADLLKQQYILKV